MMIRADYHSHTIYSDGHQTMEETILQAREKGLMTVGFSDHAWGHVFYGYKKKDLPKIRAELETMRLKYPDMRLVMAVEANIMGTDGELDVTEADALEFELVLAGYHFGSRIRKPGDLLTHALNLIHKQTGLFRKTATQRNTLAMINAMQKNDFQVLTHPGDKGPVDIRRVAQVAFEKGVLLEVNERHHNLTFDQLMEIKDIPVRFLVSSDAHRAEHIGEVSDAIDRLTRAGIDEQRILNLRRQAWS